MITSEIEKWFYKQEIVEKPKRDIVFCNLLKDIRKGYPVYENGVRFLFCRVCMKAKPIFEFTEKGRYKNLGLCKYCCK